MQPTTQPAGRSRNTIAHGATLMVLMRAVSRLIGIFSTAILARILTPDDFGLVVLGTSVLSIAQLLSEVSLGAALIRMRAPTQAHFDTAWTIALLRGALVALAVLLSAPYVAAGMHEPRVVPILWMLAATTVIQSFENIRLVDFQIHMQFGAVFRYQFLTRIVSFLATLALALVLRSYWALILSSLITAVLTVGYSYVLRPHRPRLTLAAWRDLFGFSKWALLGSYLVVTDVYSINFLMGWLGGARALGLFQVSSQIAALPASEIAAPIRPPLYAAFARLLDSPAELARTFTEGFGFLFLVITPMSLGIFATAPLLAPLALGPRWPDAPAMIEAVVFYALFDAFGHYPQNLFVVMNRQARLIVLGTVFQLVRLPLAIWGGLAGGATGAVYGMVASAVFGFVFWFAASLPLVRVRPRALVAATWRTAVAGTVMVAVLLALRRLWPAEHALALLALQLLAFAALGALLHIGVLLLLWQLSGSPAGAEARALGIAARARDRVFRLRLAPGLTGAGPAGMLRSLVPIRNWCLSQKD